MTGLLTTLLCSMALAEAPMGSEIPAGPVLTLDAAMDEARQNSPDLKQIRARLEQAWEISRRAWAGYLPQIAIGGTYTRNNVGASISLPTGYYIRDLGTPQGPAAFDPSQPESPTNPPGTATSFSQYPSGFQTATIQRLNQLAFQATLNQPLIVPPLWAGIHAAFVGQKAAELTSENARRETLFAVAQLYYGAVSLKRSLEVQERVLAVFKDRVKDAQIRFDAGSVNRITLLRAQIDLARAEQDLRRAHFSYASSRSSLAALLDRKPDFEVTEPTDPLTLSSNPTELATEAPRLRPDVQAAKFNVQAAEANHTAAWLQYFPTVGVSARYQLTNISGFIGRADSWAVVVAATWNIFDGGLREIALRENAARMAEARAAQRAAENRAQDEVRRALYDLESARANKAKADEQLRLAKENLQLVKVNSDAGAATYLEISDATANLLQAELGLVAESLNAELAVIKLARAAGRWNP